MNSRNIECCACERRKTCETINIGRPARADRTRDMGNLCNLGEAPVLKLVFDKYLEDSITEEQVQRILEPVLKMILEGRFDRPPRLRVFWNRRC